MRTIQKQLLIGATLVAAFLHANSTSAQPFGLWNFDSGDLSATVGAPLTYRGTTQTATMFGSTTALGIPAINGTPATVMMFPANTSVGLGYNMPTPAANGGGSLVNDYTILLDVLYPAGSSGRIRPIVQTDDGIITAAADLIIGSGNGIGTAEGPFFGTIAPNTWYRVAFVVHGSAQQVRMYIDGAEVGSRSIPDAFDSRFALSPSATCQILNNNDTNAAPGYVNSIQLRNVALTSGQVQALGAASASGIPAIIPAVPSFILSRSPAINATGVGPKPTINVVVDQGDTTINAGTIKLSLDGAVQPAVVTGPSANRYTVDYTVSTILEALSVHSISLVYEDNVAGSKTNTWSFTVANYQNVTLPAPIVFEDFESTAEGSVPPGWSVTNATTSAVAGFDLANPDSDTYKDFVVISHNRMLTQPGWDGARRVAIPPIVLNGVLLSTLGDGTLLYAESDVRSGNQVQAAFSPDFNMSGRSNVFLSWHSTYEQNQDNINGVEYSVDGGATWNPVIYMLNCCIDSQDAEADVHRFPNGNIDPVATLNFIDGGAAYGLRYGAFTGIETNRWPQLAPYISPRVNDDPIESKRIELVRLPLADNAPAVRLRFFQAGTASWYFGIDNLGFYSINTPVISTHPAAQTVDAGTPVTFSVVASGAGTLTYQWRRNGMSIPGATSSSYTIPSASSGDVGLYSVVVSNSDGPTTSNPAQLTVITVPQFLSNPLSQVVDVGGSVSFTASARGGQPLGYHWSFNGASQATGQTNTLTNVQTANSGNYQVVVSNSFGMATSQVARLLVFSDPPGSGNISQGLVVHLRFDNDNTDSSGRNNHGTPIGAPAFAAGKIGAGALDFTTVQNGSSFNYVSLGKPADLNFGDTNDFSVSFWAKMVANSFRGDPALVGNKNWGSGGNRGWVAAGNGGGEFQWNYREVAPNDRRDYDGPGGTFGNTNWHHIAMVFVRGGLAYTYVDGIQVNAQSLRFGLNPPTSIDTSDPALTSPNGPYDTNIGQDGTGQYTDGGSVGITNGLIDDVGIWRRAITPQETVGIYLRGLTNSDLTTASAGLAVPPSIATQPVSLTVSAGGTATFSVSAAGTAPLAYQWRKNGTDIGGATASSLTLNNVAGSDDANYSVRVSNSGGNLISADARLRVFTGLLGQDLVAYLKFNGNYRDYSGRGNNAWPRGNPTFEPGKIGQALRVTSSSDLATTNFATLGYPPDLQFGTGDFSVLFWVNVISHGSDPSFISNKDWDSSSNIGWIFSDQSAPNYLRVVCTGTPRGSGNRAQFTLAGPTLADGNWHHVAGSFWRGQNMQIYVDGAQVNTTPLLITGSVDTLTNGAPATFAVNIGQDGGGRYEGAPLDALMDDVLLYRRVVTPQEVSALYAAGSAGQDLILHVLDVTAGVGSVTISWSGGTAPYKVDRKNSLTDVMWVEVANTGSTSATVPTGGSTAYFRVRSN